MRDGIPWGRPTVDWIPLPPFGLGQRAVFVRALAQHVQMLDDGPDVVTRALVDALLSASGQGEQLSRLEFDVAVSTYFPAPWTPEAFASALDLHRPESDNPRLRGQTWRWHYDPQFEASPRPGGGWDITRNERGRIDRSSLAHDGDLVLEWMDVFTVRHHHIDFGDDRRDFVMKSLAPAVAAVRASDRAEQAYPVYEFWREHLREALNGV